MAIPKIGTRPAPPEYVAERREKGSAELRELAERLGLNQSGMARIMQVETGEFNRAWHGKHTLPDRCHCVLRVLVQQVLGRKSVFDNGKF